MAVKKRELVPKKREPVPYESKAVPVKISATSRCAVKIQDNYYTIEAGEERVIPENAGTDMRAEWSLLFAEVNGIVDNQIEDIIKTFQKK